MPGLDGYRQLKFNFICVICFFTYSTLLSFYNFYRYIIQDAQQRGLYE